MKRTYCKNVSVVFAIETRERFLQIDPVLLQILGIGVEASCSRIERGAQQ
jgi:hypothetical protein